MNRKSIWHDPRVRWGGVFVFLGLVVYLIGVAPEIFGLDRSVVFGFVQIAVMLVGLAIICLGGYLTMNGLWRGRAMSIPADIGMRLVSTGYLICVASGMADVFGFGTQAWPKIPHFGRLQMIGVEIGLATIALGFLMMIPWQEE